jgi:hypothetical protein
MPSMLTGLCPFVFEFILDETDRSFDPTLPIDEQARAALRALEAFDAQLSKSFNDILIAFENGGDVDGAYDIGELAPTHPDAEEPVTAQNVAAVIVAACKGKLWESREAQLLALRRGFSTDSVLSKEPIDLKIQLSPFLTPDLMLLVQGQAGGVSKRDLIEQCIQWPDESCSATVENGGGFPLGSTTVGLLRDLLDDESAVDAERRNLFVRWTTALSVLPDAGLEFSRGGRIRIKYAFADEPPADPLPTDEMKWPLPRASTCYHTLYVANYSRRDVLLQKLLLAMEHHQFEEAAERA